MKLLLDTHIWIHALMRPERLTAKVKRAIQSPQNELYLSPVSLWEAHHLERRGRLNLKESYTAWAQKALTRLPVRDAPFTFDIAINESSIILPQPDFGDQLIAATALALDLTLVTGDSQLLACSWLKTLPNE